MCARYHHTHPEKTKSQPHPHTHKADPLAQDLRKTPLKLRCLTLLISSKITSADA